MSQTVVSGKRADLHIVRYPASAVSDETVANLPSELVAVTLRGMLSNQIAIRDAGAEYLASLKSHLLSRLEDRAVLVRAFAAACLVILVDHRENMFAPLHSGIYGPESAVSAACKDALIQLKNVSEAELKQLIDGVRKGGQTYVTRNLAEAATEICVALGILRDELAEALLIAYERPVPPGVQAESFHGALRKYGQKIDVDLFAAKSTLDHFFKVAKLPSRNSE